MSIMIICRRLPENSERRASSVFYGSKGLSPPALKMARKFRSVYPTFVIEMSPSCLRYCSVNVPAGFMRSHISKSPQFVTLKYMNRSWSVKLFKHSERYGSGRFSGGWLMFARETFLRRGDACVFELVEKNRVVFEVSIFRRSDYT
ncbi:hypothetical protein EUGRSUZ_I00397 [Eucalyptus grandis]|uniref:Uncharacterized protein n=2 Tax=Eucalyptus grandis TaxID=71139 RepID=A0ACC3JBY9_EUCGR|nr:hypothetical protein EUGRSUZ_I00397 [Eucalyptus grandis]